MTLEGQGPGAEETPAPPARTRWSEESGEEEDVLLPPFVAGRSKPQAGPTPTETTAQGATAPDTVPTDEGIADDAPEDDGAGPRSDTADITGAAADEFGADATGEDFGGGPGGEDFGAGAAAGTVEPEAAPSVEESPFDYPWDSHRGEGEAEPEAESEPDEDWSDDDIAYGAEPEMEDEFPLGAFDIEGQDLGISGSLGRLEGFGDGESGTPGDGEVAERLERLAGILRREGGAGVERELASGDRLTMLLAGVLAGYLAGREY